MRVPTDCWRLLQKIKGLHPTRGNSRSGYVYEVPGDLLSQCRNAKTKCIRKCPLGVVANSRDIHLRSLLRHGEVIGEVGEHVIYQVREWKEC